MTGVLSGLDALPRASEKSRLDRCEEPWYNRANLKLEEQVEMSKSLPVLVIILVLVELLVKEPSPFGASQ